MGVKVSFALPGFMRNAKEYLYGVMQEVRKIEWVNRKDLIKYVIAVVIISAIITGYIYGLDVLFRRTQQLLVGLN